MKLEVLCGMIGSGKSAYARKRADEGAIIVSHDDLTAMCHGRYRYEPELRACYRRMQEEIAFCAMRCGRDVVVDRTQLTRESRAWWLAFGRDATKYLGVDLRIVAVAFPVREPWIHAGRRFDADPRGRPYDEWLKVAHHHAEQAAREPLSEDEGFDEIIRMEESPC